MKKLVHSISCFGLIFFSCIPISAQKITVVTESFPPYSYVDKKTGEHTGVATNIVKAIIKEAGVSYNLTEYPWARAYRMAQSRPNVLIYSLKRTAEREELFKWIGELSAHKSHFITLKSAKVAPFDSIEQLKTQHISVIRDGAIAKGLQDAGFTNLDLNASREVIWKKIKMGRTKIWCTDILSARYVVKQNGDDPKLIQILQPYPSEDNQSLYAAFSKQTDDKIVSVFKGALKKIKQNGVYQAILAKYNATLISK